MKKNKKRSTNRARNRNRGKGMGSAAAGGRSTHRDKDERFVGYFAVCIIDILGQKKALAGWDSIPDEGINNEQFLEALQNTVGVVETLRRGFANFYEQFRPNPDTETKLPADMRALYRDLRTSDLSIQQFSDTLIFYSPLAKPGGSFSAPYSLYQMISACCALQMLALGGKVPIRGAIHVGVGTRMRAGDFYGPALACAHHLESEVAKYPRILVSDEAIRLVKEIVRSPASTPWDRHNVFCAQEVEKLVIQDSDSCHIVHFLSPWARQLSMQVPQLRGVARKGYEFVRGEHERFCAAGDEKHAPRYHDLLSYYNAHIGSWGDVE